MNVANSHNMMNGLTFNDYELSDDFPAQIAAADLVLTILDQPAWTLQDRAANLVRLHTQLDSWYKTGPFSSQRWSTTTTTIAWQPLEPREKNFYEYMDAQILMCINRLLHNETMINGHIDWDPTNPVGFMFIFCDLVRLIMGTVDYTSVPAPYLALIAHDNHVLRQPNPVKNFLKRDAVWMQLLKDIVACVRCAESIEGINHLSEMATAVRQSRNALDTEYKKFKKEQTVLEVNAGLTLAWNRIAEPPIPDVPPEKHVTENSSTISLKQRLLRLTHD